MPDEVLEVTKNFMRNPKRILVKKEELTLEGIKQFYVSVEKEASKELFLITLCVMKLCAQKVSCFISSFSSLIQIFNFAKIECTPVIQLSVDENVKKKSILSKAAA